LGLIQRGRVIDAWAPLLTGKGIDHQVRRADQSVLHRSRRLDRQQFRHQGLIEPTAKLGQPFRQHKVLLGAIHLDLPDPTGIHHGQVRPQPDTDLLVGTGQLMFEEFQRQ
jgi:hypothetical protein